MSLSPPPPNIQSRYVRLLAMAERGTKHEAVVAEMKLASLRGRYDFSVSPRGGPLKLLSEELATSFSVITLKS
jgi:hypothetical protein